MGKAKKPKSGGKAKKDKPGAKGKKDKTGSKGKKGSKGSPSGKKAASAKSSKAPSPGQLQGKGSEKESTSESTTVPTSSQTDGSATSFKPLDRPPLEPLVLPADLDLSLPRRPSTTYVWEWGNVWFFPVGVIALAVVVLGMILMSLNIQSDYLQAPNETATAGRNATSVAVAETTGTEANELTRRWFNATKRKPRERSREPTDAVSPASINERTKASASAESATSAAGVVSREEQSTSTAVHIAGERENVATSTEAGTAAKAWLDAPVERAQDAIHAKSRLVASKSADSEENPQNASTALGTDS